MERKYMTIFLMGLLCLISKGELFSQHCLTLRYDKGGNRIVFMHRDCKKEMRGTNDHDIAEEIYEHAIDNRNDLLVYPNPSNGKFRMEFKNDTDALTELSVYNSKGVMIKSLSFISDVNVDISNNPAGVYLLRIYRNDDVRSVIVVKL